MAGLQVAMGISLCTTLRRGDIVYIQNGIHVQDGSLTLTIHKSLEQRGLIEAARLRWKLSEHPELASLIERGISLGASANCPYVVNHKPLRYNQSRSKTHSWQILPNALTKQFSLARDAAGVGGEHPPTFHEVRSTASYLLSNQGEDVTDVMDLMAHSDAEMTKLYQAGHPLPSKEMSIRIRDFGGRF